MPAYCRMVHSRPRYMFGYTPRVNGGSPGNPRSRDGSNPSTSSYMGSTSIPESVTGRSSATAKDYLHLRQGLSDGRLIPLRGIVRSVPREARGWGDPLVVWAE